MPMSQHALQNTFTPLELKRICSSHFFGALPDQLLRSILSNSDRIHMSSGEVLFHKGDTVDGVYCVLSGTIKLSINQIDGREAVIEIFHEGHSFAEALAFNDATYPATASALQDSVVLRVPKPFLKQSILQQPETAEAVLAGIVLHLHKLVRQIESLKTNSAQERLVQYILTATDDQQTSARLEVPFEKKILAALLGVTPETLSRLFKQLQSHGVSLEKRVITVRDRKALIKLSSEFL